MPPKAMVRIDRVRKRIKDLREAANEPYPATPEGRSEAEKRYERACQAFVNEFPTLASIERALTDIGYAGAATVTRDDYAKWDLQNTYAKKPLPPGSQAPGWTTELVAFLDRLDEDLTKARLAVEETPPPEAEQFIFAPEGDGYYIAGFGQQGHFKATKGFAVVARLIRTPSQPVLMTELVGEGDDQREANDQRSRQETLDGEAIRAIREKRAELQQDLERAQRENNTVDMDVAQREIDELESQVRRDTGLAGRPRDLNSETDQLRPRIHGNLKTAWATLRKATPPATELAAHLEAAISSESGAFIYRPGIQIKWAFSVPPKK